jgi:hypothetical protein
MSKSEPEHTYPDQYSPGSHWAITRGWEIVDLIKPGILSDQARALLCGAIEGALINSHKSPKHCRDNPHRSREAVAQPVHAPEQSD